MTHETKQPPKLYVCREQPDRANPRATGRFAVRQESVWEDGLDRAGREVAVITLSGHKIGEEKSPEDWAALFAAAPETAAELERVKANVEYHKGQVLNGNAQGISAINRAKKAEAERDTLKAAYQNAFDEHAKIKRLALEAVDRAEKAEQQWDELLAALKEANAYVQMYAQFAQAPEIILSDAKRFDAATTNCGGRS